MLAQAMVAALSLLRSAKRKQRASDTYCWAGHRVGAIFFIGLPTSAYGCVRVGCYEMWCSKTDRLMSPLNITIDTATSTPNLPPRRREIQLCDMGHLFLLQLTYQNPAYRYLDRMLNLSKSRSRSRWECRCPCRNRNSQRACFGQQQLRAQRRWQRAVPWGGRRLPTQ